MIKGVNKYVIEVIEPKNRYYDKVLLFIRPEYAEAVEQGILEKEAKKVLKSMDAVSAVKRHKQRAWWLIYLMSIVIMGLLFSIIFLTLLAISPRLLTRSC